MDLGAKGAVFVPFFHDLAATNTALFRLAKHMNLPVLPCVCRMTYYGYEVMIHPRFLEFEAQLDETSAMQCMNEKLAQTIQELGVSQYYWLHKRFKTRPH
jgi:KDO2-lipid IV(A) lauroyltransferase